MKRLSIIFAALLLGIVVFNACTEDDVTGPVITIIGDNPVDHLLNTDYDDDGATAQDDKDGALVIEVTSNVDVDNIGTYEVNYYAEDKSGNGTTATRTVNVIVKQISYQHTWKVADSVVGVGQGIYDYFCTITPATQTNKLLISNFGGFGNSVIVEATFDKFGNITIPSQQLIGAPPGSEGTVIGNGTTVSHGNILNINYTITYDAGGSDNGYATFVKQ